MPDTDIQIVSNEAGEPTAVIVPIGLWREIASERQTAQRRDGLSLDAVVEKLGI